jgi:hypothetical protein
MPRPNSQILLIINQESGLDEELSLTILRSLIVCIHLPMRIYSKDDGAKVNQRGSWNYMSNNSSQISPERINSLLSKLRLRTLTKDEAKGFLPLLEKEVKSAREGDRKEYEKIMIRLIKIVELFLYGSIDLNSISFDVLNELESMELS